MSKFLHNIYWVFANPRIVVRHHVADKGQLHILRGDEVRHLCGDMRPPVTSSCFSDAARRLQCRVAVCGFLVMTILHQ